MKVRITNGRNGYWYRDLVGEIYDNYTHDARGWYIGEGLHKIKDIDAEVVEEFENSCDNCYNGMVKSYEWCRSKNNENVCDNWKEYDNWQPIEQAEEKKVGCAYCKPNGMDSCGECAFNKIIGNGTDTPIITNSQGGKQSKIDTAFSLVPHDALLAVAKVMKIGSERYAKDNWRKLSSDEIYDHLMEHFVNWHMTGDMEELEHGMTRVMMLYSVVNKENV